MCYDLQDVFCNYHGDQVMDNYWLFNFIVCFVLYAVVMSCNIFVVVSCNDLFGFLFAYMVWWCVLVLNIALCGLF